MTTPIAALREELFYRAILLGSLERAMHPVAAILLAALLFVLSHIGAQPFTLLTISSLAVLGVMLGVVYQRTRILWLVVCIHSVFNVAILLIQVDTYQPFLAFTANSLAILAVLGWWSLDRSRERMRL